MRRSTSANPAGVTEMIQKIGARDGLGDDLAEGTRRMSEKYGGKEFAMHVKGLELSAYDPRGSYAQGVEYATTNRGGCHVQGASMYMESTGPLTINPQSLKLKADIPVLQQNLACAINSMVLCIFTTYGMIPKQIHEMDPNSFTYKLITTLFENSGPMMRIAMSMKGQAHDVVREVAHLHHGRDLLERPPAGDRRAHLQPRAHVQPARGADGRRRHAAPPHPVRAHLQGHGVGPPARQAAAALLQEPRLGRGRRARPQKTLDRLGVRV